MQGCTKLTDTGIGFLSPSLSKLTCLNLAGCTRIGDKGVAVTAQLKDLASLSLNGNPRITDRCLKNLSRLRSLTVLHLDGCRNFTDRGVQQLSKLPNLSILSITECPGVQNNSAGALAPHVSRILAPKKEGRTSQANPSRSAPSTTHGGPTSKDGVAIPMWPRIDKVQGSECLSVQSLTSSRFTPWNIPGIETVLCGYRQPNR